MKLLRLLFGWMDEAPRRQTSKHEIDDAVRAWTLHQRHSHYSGRPQFWS